MRIIALLIVSLLFAASAGTPAALAVDWVEAPALADRVSSGELPPIAERVPMEPRVIDLEALGRETGRYGGTLSMLMGKQKDVKMMVVYGYARLVAFDESLNLVPDILESVEVEEGRIFTFHLREGHRWSDGHPFTTEDFRYYWEDVVNHPDLGGSGPPRTLLVNDQPPQVDYVSDTEIRYTWSAPNPEFLPALAGASPLFLYRPSHYLSQFHASHQDPDVLAAMVEEAGLENWRKLHLRVGRQYRPENPDNPTLQPWANSTPTPADRFVFLRNPYFHRVDTQGHQLPYIDEVVLTMGTTSLIPAKASSGETQLQARYLAFDDYPFLKEAEERNDYTVRLWRTAKGSQVSLYPNLNSEDPAWRELMRDVRFRRALSLGIFREEIAQVIYYGLVQQSADTVLPDSPLFDPSYRDAWIQYDVAQANALLDEIGLTERTSEGIRLMPDGRELEVIVTTAGESTEETDVLELIGSSWEQIGVKLLVHSSQREVFRNRIFAGQSVMAVWSGLTNAVPTPEMSPWELAPTTQQQLQWPMWGQYYESGGTAGVEADMPEAQRLLELFGEWQHAVSDEEKTAAWRAMLALYTDQVFSIGIVNSARQPVVVGNTLRNVPVDGVYNWDPGAYFGMYLMDAFWFDE
jgi:peptide/nickel transport system substrate-binding protein